MKEHVYRLLLMGVSSSCANKLDPSVATTYKHKIIRLYETIQSSGSVIGVGFPLDIIITTALVFNRRGYTVKFVYPTLENFNFNSRKHLFVFPEADITDFNPILRDCITLILKGYKFLFKVGDSVESLPSAIKGRSEILYWEGDDE